MYVTNYVHDRKQKIKKLGFIFNYINFSSYVCTLIRFYSELNSKWHFKVKNIPIYIRNAFYLALIAPSTCNNFYSSFFFAITQHFYNNTVSFIYFHIRDLTGSFQMCHMQSIP